MDGVVIRQRDFLIANRRRLALLVTLGVLALAVAAEHAGLGHGDMTHPDMGQAISICLAVVEAGAVLIGALALVAIRPRVTRTRAHLFAHPATTLPATSAALPRARASPPVLQVFRR